MFISANTEAELRYGVALLPAGKRRSALATVIEDMLGDDFAGRILPFDSAAAVAFANIGDPSPGWPAHRPGGRANCRDRTVAGCGSGDPKRF